MIVSPIIGDGLPDDWELANGFHPKMAGGGVNGVENYLSERAK